MSTAQERLDREVWKDALEGWEFILKDPTHPDAIKTVDGKPYTRPYVRRRIAALKQRLAK